MAVPASDSVSFSTSQVATTEGVVRSGGDENPAQPVDPLRRGVAWSAMLIGSAVPTIIARVSGHDTPYFLPVTQTVILVILAVIADRSQRLRPLTGFLLTVAILRLGWFFIAPVLADWAPIHDALVGASWSMQQFMARLLNVAGALLMLTTFIKRRFTCKDLFLRIGQLNAPSRPEPILWFRKPTPWTRLGPQLLLVFGVALPAFLFFTLRPSFGEPGELWHLMPWALATAAVNAANEEFQFRCVPLAHLNGVLSVRESLWLTSIFFGLGHYFGQPSGPIGVVMATIAGWIWAKSMIETRGAGWAFGIHMVQDVVIFYFLAMSLKP